LSAIPLFPRLAPWAAFLRRYAPYRGAEKVICDEAAPDQAGEKVINRRLGLKGRGFHPRRQYFLKDLRHG